jgi:hypothetical protein
LISNIQVKNKALSDNASITREAYLKAASRSEAAPDADSLVETRHVSPRR